MFNSCWHLLFKDIDKKVDRRLILRLKQNTEFFTSALDLNLTLPVYIYGKDGETWMSTYFPKLDSSLRQKMDLLIRKFDGKEKENSFVVDTRINNVEDLAILDQVLEVPSFIVDRSDMSNGYLNVHGRFHHSQAGRISALLSELTLDSESARIDWLGASPGIKALTDMTHSIYQLSLVGYEVPIEDEEQIYTNLLSDENTIAEIRNSRIIDGRVSLVLYSNGPLEEEIGEEHIISAQDGIYQFQVLNRVHNEIRNSANERNILRSRYFVRKKGDNLEILTFLPTSGLYEYYSLLFEIARNSGNELWVTNVLPYSEYIWDTI